MLSGIAQLASEVDQLDVGQLVSFELASGDGRRDAVDAQLLGEVQLLKL